MTITNITVNQEVLELNLSKKSEDLLLEIQEYFGLYNCKEETTLKSTKKDFIRNVTEMVDRLEIDDSYDEAVHIYIQYKNGDKFVYDNTDGGVIKGKLKKTGIDCGYMTDCWGVELCNWEAEYSEHGWQPEAFENFFN